MFGELPDATVELDRVVPTNVEVVPYFWLRDPNLESAVGLVSAVGTRRHWSFGNRGDDREAVARFSRPVSRHRFPSRPLFCAKTVNTNSGSRGI